MTRPKSKPSTRPGSRAVESDQHPANGHNGNLWRSLFFLLLGGIGTGIGSFVTFGMDKVTRDELKEAFSAARSELKDTFAAAAAIDDRRFAEADKDRERILQDQKATNETLRALASRVSELVGELKGQRERDK